ncbi:hypothetical protein GW17_00055346 [Ensete ventricosum]|nr:hypothetical protein GW17_00055346 [Ensete ventricosum]
MVWIPLERTKAPCKGAADHLQGAIAHRGNSPQGAATRGRSRLRPGRKGGCQRRARKGDCQRCARKGQLPAASPQEAATVHPQGATTTQRRRLRRGSDDDDDGTGG